MKMTNNKGYTYKGIPFDPTAVMITGSHTATVMLGHLMSILVDDYARGELAIDDWLPVPQSDFYKFCGLTKYQQNKAIKILEELEWIDVVIRKSESYPTKHFKFNEKTYNDDIKEFKEKHAEFLQNLEEHQFN